MPRAEGRLWGYASTPRQPLAPCSLRTSRGGAAQSVEDGRPGERAAPANALARDRGGRAQGVVLSLWVREASVTSDLRRSEESCGWYHTNIRQAQRNPSLSEACSYSLKNGGKIEETAIRITAAQAKHCRISHQSQRFPSTSGPKDFTAVILSHMSKEICCPFYVY
ncbi:hypothetical protein HYPSUDRAFT_801856 [Hypholoma sublateritium FD-334 SS-4]|uniref:Uncharacterized protein n=1 Tax=Hypholoma sublateritium (strain FD-334 SS-4) TaxID=945553 RepID=A0A0D2PI05_HYPSF|nr:hypothetical protein HYPSUDRAFT_801856 [Hypholoma sublateritium FD-334 SS-4]